MSTALSGGDPCLSAKFRFNRELQELKASVLFVTTKNLIYHPFRCHQSLFYSLLMSENGSNESLNYVCFNEVKVILEHRNVMTIYFTDKAPKNVRRGKKLDRINEMTILIQFVRFCKWKLKLLICIAVNKHAWGWLKMPRSINVW